MCPFSIFRFPVLAGAMLFTAFGLSGCSGGDEVSAVLSWSSGTKSQLYVSGNLGDWLLSYNNATTVSGSTPPSRTVSGGNTSFNAPRGIAVDMARDQVYVANFDGDAILVFNDARTLTGDVVPDRVITGLLTTLSGPSALFYDVFNDRLYVANTGDDSILVFDNASTKENNVAPDRTLKGDATTLNAPSGVLVDLTRNRMYVINGGSNSILVFNDAVSVDGDTAPTRTVTSGSLNAPGGGALDVFLDRLYVANAGSDSILVFNDISTIFGNKVPSRTIAGALTTLDQPHDLYFDLAGDRLYVANTGSDSVLVFDDASLATGNKAPNRTLALTPGTDPWGIFVDVTPVVGGSTAALDGDVDSDGLVVSAGGAPRTGDVEDFFDTVAHRQFYSFDFSNLPSGANVSDALLRLYQADFLGTPYGTMGSVVVDHVDYGATLDGVDYAVVAIQGNVGTLSTNVTEGYKSLLVTSRVQNDLDNVRQRSQYRLRFSLSDTNNDFNSDYVRFTDFEDSCCGVNRPPQLAVVFDP